MARAAVPVEEVSKRLPGSWSDLVYQCSAWVVIKMRVTHELGIQDIWVSIGSDNRSNGRDEASTMNTPMDEDVFESFETKICF